MNRAECTSPKSSSQGSAPVTCRGESRGVTVIENSPAVGFTKSGFERWSYGAHQNDYMIGEYVSCQPEYAPSEKFGPACSGGARPLSVPRAHAPSGRCPSGSSGQAVEDAQASAADVPGDGVFDPPPVPAETDLAWCGDAVRAGTSPQGIAFTIGCSTCCPPVFAADTSTPAEFHQPGQDGDFDPFLPRSTGLDPVIPNRLDARRDPGSLRSSRVRRRCREGRALRDAVSRTPRPAPTRPSCTSFSVPTLTGDCGFE